MESATRKPTRSVGATGFAVLRLGLAALLFPLPLTNPGAAAAQPLDVPGMVRVTVEVEWSCPSCALGLERRLGRLDHVAGVDVRPADGRIVLTVEPGRHLDLAAVRNTVRNAGFIPDGVAVTAIGHLTHANGAPALALSTDFAIPLAANGTAALETEAGDRLVRVTGNWNAPPDGAGRLQVLRGSLSRHPRASELAELAVDRKNRVMSTILPINLDDLLRCRGVESERMEFKASWDPRQLQPTRSTLPAHPVARNRRRSDHPRRLGSGQ